MPPSQPSPLPKINDQQMREALLRSGYLLEYRVENLIQEYGYFTQANQAYPDPLTGKSRELDLSSISAEHVGPHESDYLFQVILTECVNNPQPMAFFTKESIAPIIHADDLRFSGIPIKIKSGSGWRTLANFLEMEQFHHHCKGRIATQFCSFSPKKGSQNWMAHHDDQHFDSFNKLCFSLEHEIDDHYSNWKPGEERFNVQMYYLVLVVSGQLFDVLPTTSGLTLTETDQVHYVQSFIRQSKQQSYHIDVVTERFVPRLLDLIEKEAKGTVRRLRKHKRQVATSIADLATGIHRLRSPESIRARLE